MKYNIINRTPVLLMGLLSLCTVTSCKKEITNIIQPVDPGAPPVITGFTPGTSWYNNLVEINGNNFSTELSDNTVTIGKVKVEILEASTTRLKVRVAPEVTGGYIHVTTKGQEAISTHQLLINQLAWQKTIGGSRRDIATAIYAAGSGYFVVGYTESNDGDITTPLAGGTDMWFAKLDSARHIVWQKSLGGSGGDYTVAAAPATDGGYYITGYSYSIDGDFKGALGISDIWVIKVDGNGTVLWKKPFGGSVDEQPGAVITAPDGGCVVAGYTYSKDGDVKGQHGSEDLWVIKVSATGNLVWQKTLGSTAQEFASAITLDADGGYLVAGNTNGKDGDVTNPMGDWDMWVIKLNSSGGLVWQKTAGGNDMDGAYAITASPEGGSAVAGYAWSKNGDVTNAHTGSEMWVVKLNATGGLSWQKTMGGSGSEGLFAIAATDDGGYVVAGNTNSIDGDIKGNHGGQDLWIAKINADRTLSGQRTIGGSMAETLSSMSIAPDNGYLLAGFTVSSTDGDVTDPHGVWDMWLLKVWE